MTSGERRSAIVRSAIHLFAEKGFRGTTTRELAAALGVTEPVLYQHFRTKQELYSAIIEATAADASRHVSALRRLAQSDDDETFFRTLAAVILDRYQQDPQVYRLLLFSCLERHQLSDLFFERLFRNFHKLVSGYIRRRIRSGAFRRVSPEIAARALIGMISYHGQTELLFPGRLGRLNGARVADQVVTVFLEGIRA